MTIAMSYPYPLPTSRPDSNLASPIHEYPLPPAPNFVQMSSPSESRASAGSNKPPGKVKPAASSPNSRGQAASDAAAAEKRRNKLGYHRTSVACGHCRRRKIRCIPAVGDAQNRCSNCIRLKKECNFYPVDQQPPTDNRNPRDGNLPRGSSTSMSPPEVAGQLPDMQANGPFSPHLQMPPLGDGRIPQGKLRGEGFGPDNKLPGFGRGPEFGPPGQWIPSDHPSMAKGQPEQPSPYWREGPSSSAYTPFPQLSHQQPWPPSATEPSSREEVGWTGPIRSISYGSADHVPHTPSYSHYAHPAAGSSREDYTPRGLHPHEPYIPTLGSSAGLPPTSTDASPPASATNAPHYPPGEGWQPQYGFPRPAVPASAEGYPGWYGPGPHVPSSSHGGPGEVIPPGPYGPGETYPASVYYPQHTQGGRQ